MTRSRGRRWIRRRGIPGVVSVLVSLLGVTAACSPAAPPVPPLRVEGQGYANAIRSLVGATPATPAEFRDVALTGFAGNRGELSGMLEVRQANPGRDAASGAVPRSAEQIRFTLVGQRPAAVSVVGMTARIVARAAPPTVLVVVLPDLAANPSPTDAMIGFDLDSPRLDARVVPDGHLPGDGVYVREPMTLAPDERRDLVVYATTSRCVCDFVIDVTTADGMITTVDDGGRPWRATAFAPTYERSYFYDLTSATFDECEWPSGCVAGMPRR